MLAMATTALSGMWKKPGRRVPDALSSSSTHQLGKEVRAPSNDPENVQYLTSNSHARLPGLCGVESKRSRRRGREDRSWQEKEIDQEFSDFVIMPSDGCYMSGSDSDDSDYSVGWFEPHSVNFTDNEDEEKFQVLVPSYRSTAIQLSPKSSAKSDNKDSNTPPWASLLSNLTHYTNSDMQNQLELWLQSLTSNN